MKLIGQFAKENDVTVKTLHHYEKLGLLDPLHVDQATGYRYYGDEQVDQLNNIVYLKNLGFSLSEIKAFFTDSYTPKAFLQVLTLKKQQSAQDKESASLRYHHLNQLIGSIKDNDTFQINYKELIHMSQEKLYTGKYGRGRFIEESERMFDVAKRNNTPLSVIQLDLDSFHQVNVDYGYDVGDVVLQRSQDEMLAFFQSHKYPFILERKGGDEFSITIEIEHLKLPQVVTKLLNHIVSIDYSDMIEGLKVSVTAGMSHLTKKTKTYAELVQDATIQLYQLKRSR